MKTQVIHLEPYDDVVSARDKMGWGQTQRILLVWPPRARLLRRQLDLKLLQRHSRLLGAQLALVSRDPDTRFYAEELGIPVFRSIHKAQTERWRRVRRGRAPSLRRPEPARPVEDENGAAPGPRERFNALKAELPLQQPAWLEKPAGRMGVFSLGVLAVLAIAAVLLPSAEVRLQPEVRAQLTTFTAQASPEVSEISTSGTVPARLVVVEVEGRGDVPAGGQAEIPSRAAQGSVRFTNLTDRSVTVPAGTSVLTLGEDPIRFTTTRAGTVPAGAGRSLTLPAEAVTRGAAGNLPEGALQAVEGPLGLRVSVTNPFATRGGADFVVAAPNAADRAALRRELLESLELTALAEIQRTLSAGDFLIAPSLTLQQVVEEIYDPEAGQPGERLSLQLRVVFEAQVVSGADLDGLAGAILNASLPAGFASKPGSLQVEHLSDPEISPGGEARWRLRARRQIAWQLSHSQVVNLILGLEPAGAARRLDDSLSLEAPAEIALKPDWWPRLPILPFRVRLAQEG